MDWLLEQVKTQNNTIMNNLLTLNLKQILKKLQYCLYLVWHNLTFRYIVLYLSTGLTFAVIYTSLPGHFYHATLKYEAYVNHKADLLMEDLKTAWIAQHASANQRHNKITRFEGIEYIVDMDTLKLFRPEVEGEYLLFTVDCNGYWVEQPGQLTHPIAFDFQAKTHVSCLHLGNVHLPHNPFRSKKNHTDVHLQVKENNESADEKGFFRPVPLPSASLPTPVPFNEIPPVPVPAPVLSSAAPSQVVSSLPFVMDVGSHGHFVLTVPDDVFVHMDGLVRAANGFPSRIDNKFGRMLYFSFTTLTTVGYGDIVPLTGIARMLISMESVLGIVLIGMFLNSTTAIARRGNTT